MTPRARSVPRKAHFEPASAGDAEGVCGPPDAPHPPPAHWVIARSARPVAVEQSASASAASARACANAPVRSASRAAVRRRSASAHTTSKGERSRPQRLQVVPPR